MTDLSLSAGEMFALLVIGMGPARVSLAYLPVAPLLDRRQQREVALRTVLAGFVLVVVVMLVGGGTIRSYAPRVEIVLIASGLVVLSVTIAAMARRPAPPGEAPAELNHKAFAVSPLAVPVMINPVGVAVLFSQSAYVNSGSDRVTFVAIAIGILVANYVALLYVPFVARAIAVPVLRVAQEVFSLLTVALGVRMILIGLDGLGAIDVS